MTLDEDREAAIRRSVGQGLAWNLELELPRLLARLNAIDAAHAAGQPVRIDGQLATREEITALIEQAGGPSGLTDEQIIEWWNERSARVLSLFASVPAPEIPADQAPAALRAKPATAPRRRTTRNAT